MSNHLEVIDLMNENANLRSELAKARLIMAELCDQIEATEEHGGGADESDCPICEAMRDARRFAGGQS